MVNFKTVRETVRTMKLDLDETFIRRKIRLVIRKSFFFFFFALKKGEITSKYNGVKNKQSESNYF